MWLVPKDRRLRKERNGWRRPLKIILLTLQRFLNAKDERNKRGRWQLVKTDRNARTVSQKRDDESALSKRTMAEIAEAADALWESNRK
jgi:hypothetical protein